MPDSFKRLLLPADLYAYLAWRADRLNRSIAAELRNIILELWAADAGYQTETGHYIGARPARVTTARVGRPPGTTMQPVPLYLGVFRYGASFKAKNRRGKLLGTFNTLESAARAVDDFYRGRGVPYVNIPDTAAGEILAPERSGCQCAPLIFSGQHKSSDCPGFGKTHWDQPMKRLVVDRPCPRAKYIVGSGLKNCTLRDDGHGEADCIYEGDKRDGKEQAG